MSKVPIVTTVTVVKTTKREECFNTRWVIKYFKQTAGTKLFASSAGLTVDRMFALQIETARKLYFHLSKALEFFMST